MPTKRARAAYEGPQFTLAQAVAVKHLALGDADADAQKRALDWIMTGVLGLKDSPYDPDSTHNMAYAVGRQDAAREIALYVTLPTDALDALAKRRNPQRKGTNG